MYLELATLPPKSKIIFLQIPNNNYTKDSFFQYFFVGKKSSFTKIPIVDFLEDANSLHYTTYSSSESKIYVGPYQIKEQTFWFGTDRFGRDLLSRIIYGVRVSIAVGLIAVFISLIIGITLGLIAGYFRGRTDDIIMWFVNVICYLLSIICCTPRMKNR